MTFDAERADRLSRELATLYREKFAEEWQDSLRTPPEWYDHHIDLYLWRDFGNGFWVERGVLTAMAMRYGEPMLDLCCGDGFYAKTFYSAIASRVHAVDRDTSAIEHARKHHAAQNIAYAVRDVLAFSPDENFGTVALNAAVEHLSL